MKTDPSRRRPAWQPAANSPREVDGGEGAGGPRYARRLQTASDKA